MKELRETDVIDIEASLQEVRRRIAQAAARVGRDPNGITLVAVTKRVSAERIVAAYQLGIRHFGENRVQEAQAKIPTVNRWLEATPPPGPTSDFGLRTARLSGSAETSDLTWHMVGHLQRNKVKRALELFDIIHSVDSVRLAREISRRCQRAERTMPILLEVNVSGEGTKYGFAPGEIKAAVEDMVTLPGLTIQGLMTMAPIVEDPEEARPYFRRLRQLRDELRGGFPQVEWRHLSMGMTDDFEVAVEEGATMVRIGRAIFGQESTSQKPAPYIFRQRRG
ncbi:MAG: YggS family pyridoxal phosphate-dependent enzyme [Anaerolineae bacterium]